MTAVGRKGVAILVLVALGLVACDPIEPIEQPDPWDGGPALAVQFGNSLTSGSREELLDLYAADPAWRVSRNDYPGTQFDTGAWVRRYPSVGTGSTVVLAFGTNDLATEASVQAVKADARAAIVAVTDAGAVRVVVPTLNETTAASLGRLERTQQWNAWLWQAENSLHLDYRALDVVDWAAVSAGRTDWVAEDQLHHNAAGQAAYAQFLYEARLP